jgi:hypothetical protein
MEYIYFRNDFICNFYALIASIFFYCTCNLIGSEIMGAAVCRGFIISLVKQQFVVTYWLRQTDIPALLDRWFSNTTSVKTSCPQKKNALVILS